MKNEELDKTDIIKNIEIESVKGECPNTTIQLKRNCPICDREIYHISKESRIRSIKLNIKCIFCRNKNNRFSTIAIINSKKTLNRLKELNKGKLNRLCPLCNQKITYKSYGSWWMAKKNDCRCRECLSLYRKGTRLSEEAKRKLSVGRMGEKHHFFGKIHSDEYKKKMSLRLMGSKNGFYGRKHTNKTKELIGKQSKERFEKSIYAPKMREYFIKHKKLLPFFNETACYYFDKLNENKICHALNGGEYEFLGYFADGYDKENNIWYEWDEKHHFDIDGQLKPKDIKRINEIQQKLNCRFIRIKESTGLVYMDLKPVDEINETANNFFDL